jgi:hypothetical protein
VRDVQTIQKFKIIHVFGSSYCWLYLNFVRVGKLCESVCIIAVKKNRISHLSQQMKTRSK